MCKNTAVNCDIEVVANIVNEDISSITAIGLLRHVRLVLKKRRHCSVPDCSPEVNLTPVVVAHLWLWLNSNKVTLEIFIFVTQWLESSVSDVMIKLFPYRGKKNHGSMSLPKPSDPNSSLLLHLFFSC